MSVELEPAELGFRRPFTHEVSQTLRLHNPNSEPVAFKVKTTAPKQYCVRPNSGKIESGATVEVQVLLQAMKEDPPPDAKCRDKFLVQSVAIPSEHQGLGVSQVWAGVEQTAKGSIQEKKIRVTFLPADGSAPSVNGVNSHHEDEHLPAYASPSSSMAAVTPQKSTAGAVGAISTPSERPANATNRGEAVSTAHNPATEQSTLGSAAAAVGNTLGVSQQDLQRQLDAANAKIKELQASASEGLRQRKTTSGESSSSGSTSTSLQHAPAPGGVPVQIVAAIALLSFLIAYLFF
ncbi:(VAMP)-associated protein [Teratosphaeria destructans]|uniref:(VAMP)-associated protein n=1 Tax=Teratosphaeria destructans TaxID=418781 RepID=A0A9W7SIJ2_9PEZI|nr:(VAMP)-associated protein [Teratosphaeria destructans]